MIERRKITTLLVTQLETLAFPVGVAANPTEGGWQGEPNTDGTNFKPYSVVTPNPSSAGVNYAEGPISDWQADWRLSYTVSSFGVQPEQTEWMADKARMVLESLRNTVYDAGTNNYLVQQVRVDALGGLVRVDATEPPYWGQSDQITIWLSEE